MWRGTLSTYLKRLALASALAPLGCGNNPFNSPCPTQTVYFMADGNYDVDAGVGSMLSQPECAQLCGNPGVQSCTLTQPNQVACVEVTPCHTGRRPAGLRAPLVDGDSLGAHFARMAHLEAASAPAFVRLAGELRVHGAPRALVASAERAALDEQRHARAVGALARRFGAGVPAVVIDEAAERALDEIAVDNAAEGCVGETWGALLALEQARAAGDARVRSAMAAIAEDEARHAELAFRVARWADRFLDDESRRRVTRARHAAARALAASLAVEPAPPLREVAGLPSAARALTLFSSLARDVWS